MADVKIGSKKTKQREAVLRVLRDNPSHPDARLVYEKVRQELPRISLGTIYRNLELLARSGVIRQLHTARGYYRYDSDTSDHGHIACRTCGRLWDVPVDAQWHSLRQRAESARFQDVVVRIDLEGVCVACAAGS
ncbi:MAG: Fur family transcriptional regulator [Dehalococcoidia bacterium]